MKIKKLVIREHIEVADLVSKKAQKCILGAYGGGSGSIYCKVYTDCGLMFEGHCGLQYTYECESALVAYYMDPSLGFGFSGVTAYCHWPHN